MNHFAKSTPAPIPHKRPISGPLAASLLSQQPKSHVGDLINDGESIEGSEMSMPALSHSSRRFTQDPRSGDSTARYHQKPTAPHHRLPVAATLQHVLERAGVPYDVI